MRCKCTPSAEMSRELLPRATSNSMMLALARRVSGSRPRGSEWCEVLRPVDPQIPTLIPSLCVCLQPWRCLDQTSSGFPAQMHTHTQTHMQEKAAAVSDMISRLSAKVGTNRSGRCRLVGDATSLTSRA